MCIMPYWCLSGVENAGMHGQRGAVIMIIGDSERIQAHGPCVLQHS